MIIVSVIVVYGMFVYEMKKIPPDYKVISEHEGQDRILETLGGQLSPPFWIRETLTQEAINLNGDILEIRSTVRGVDSATNNMIFDNENLFYVDRATRKHQETDDYFSFPPNVQKQNYNFFHPMIFTKTVFEFVGTKSIDGLEVYDFTCSYDKTDVSNAFPQFPSQTIISDGKCTASVEPVTGMMVSFSKEWDDYISNDGVRGEQVEIGGKHTTEYSEAILVENAKSVKSLYYLLDFVFPVLITVIGIAIIIVIMLFAKTKHQTITIINAQNELLKKERMSTIGEITAKLSHDLRNSVTAIKMSSESMQMRLEKKMDPKLEENIPRINEAVARMIHQISQILGFVKTMPFDIRLVSLSAILEDALKYTDIPDSVAVRVPKEDYSLMADRIQLSIAFGNILSNAVDAMNGKGEIIIRASADDHHLSLEFENTGSEIPQDDLKKIFEPLFTTKTEGTGLGLSSVRDIINMHNGRISVTSPPTIFRITIPLAQKSK